MTREDAVRRHVAARQVPIAPTAAPIMVDSAFGGLAIYRREATLGATYVGLYPDGEEVCEHVAFNASLKGADGVLAIYPALLTHAPEEHVIGALGSAKTFTLEQDGAKCTLIGPPDHLLEGFRAEYPLYDRRLPALARIVARDVPNAWLIDVGANIGDSIALTRLAGATMPAIAIDASLSYCKYLWANMQSAPALFGDVRLVWGFVGAEGEAGAVSLGAGTSSAAASGTDARVERAPGVTLAGLAGGLDVSLVKTDTDGFDQDIVAAELDFLRTKAPILWLEAQTMAGADETKWRALLDEMAGQWPRMILFDNFGFAIAAGDTAGLAGPAVDLMAYGRRQRERPNFRPTLYYLDIALFPARFDHLYDEFRESLPELNA